MPLTIDLLSDMHREQQLTENQHYDYAGNKQNDIVIAAGDLASNASTALEELKKLSDCYKTVLFIDGNYEFLETFKTNRDYNLEKDEITLREGIAQLPNVTYLQDTIYINGKTAIIGANGHWEYKCVPEISYNDAIAFFAAHNNAPDEYSVTVFDRMAHRDFENIRDKVIKLNDDASVETIAIVTHTVPRVELLDNTGFDLRKCIWMANTELEQIPAFDKNKKITTWMFGHQHQLRDTLINNIRYIAHPRGMPRDQDRLQKDYRPLSVTIETAQPVPKFNFNPKLKLG